MVRWKGSLRGGRGLIASVAVPFALALGACDGTTDWESPASDPQAEATGEIFTKQPLQPGLVDEVRSTGFAKAVVLIDDRAQQNLRANQLAVLGGFGDDEGFARALDATKDRVLARLTSQPIAPLARLRRLPFLHVRIDSPEALQALAADPEVLAVAPETSYQLLQTVASNLSLINQPKAAAAGQLGAGTAVAVLDTGTDYKRAPFSCAQPGGDCKVAHAADFAAQDNLLDDSRGHGTNVAGIVLAVAPATKILALDVFTPTGALTGDILAAINWVIENRTKYNIAAMNMSFGGGAFTSACTTDIMAIAIDRARAVGILSAVAAGNEAKSTSLSSPACGPAAVSVGAVYPSNVGPLISSVCRDMTSMANQVACFSNSTSFLTLLAPGVYITAAGLTMTGTSQAAPHVAGAIAVLKAAFPGETPSARLDRLVKTGLAVKDLRNSVSKPRIDLAAALAAPAVAAPPPPPPAPPPPPPPTPVGTITLADGAKFTRQAIINVAVPTTTGVATHVCLSAEPMCTAWIKWAPTVSFTLPGADGAKTVRVWWKNAAGAVTAAPKTASITLDRAAPVGGRMMLSLSSGRANYAWSGITDTLSGIAKYKLMGSTTALPPAACSSGTLLANGPGLVASQAVVKGRTYYFRLCAVDNANNVSAGLTGQFVAR
ncbi:MAG TPA: S8 family serine peptidase [Polyangia bacterium]